MKGTMQKLKLGRKSSATSTSKQKPVLVQPADKLADLRAKIEKDREIMRKSGKRFHKAEETEQLPLPQQKPEQSFAKKQQKAVEVSTTMVPQRHSVPLAELIPAEQTVPSMQASRIFEKEVSEQKIRNKQIVDFLTPLKLEGFAEGLIGMGYDELAVLVEIKPEELNFLMMRAPQQKKLCEALKAYRSAEGIAVENEQRIVPKPAAFKVKTQMTEMNEQVARPKSAVTETSTIPTNNSMVNNGSGLFSNPSFFYSIGGGDWSMECLVRKACSGCFKVFPALELEQRQECFYCAGCRTQEDMFQLSLSDSMVRDYS